MQNLIVFLFFLLLLTGCKKEIATSGSSERVTQVSYQEYSPNPDEVIFELESVNSSFSNDSWRNEVRVIRQLKAGFGFKDRIRTGSTIILITKEKLTRDRFYCSAEYQLSENNQGTKTFVLRQYLTQ